MDRASVAVYEREAARYAASRPPRHRRRAQAFARRVDAARRQGVGPGPVVDLGCGHGPYLGDLPRPTVALDAAKAMLGLARGAAPHALAVRADLEALPFRDRSLAGAWSRNGYVHVPREQMPLALARLQWALAVNAPVTMSVLDGDREGPWPGDPFPGRRFVPWRRGRLADLLVGAGLEDVRITASDGLLWARCRRGRTLPDTVGPGMRALVCGLNPSLVAADAGFGFAGPSNRFWKAAITSGLVSRPRDPLRALAVDAVGMTDLVKRATPRADLLTADEYRAGAGRVARLVAWLRPAVVVFVGLTGWRAAIDPRARPGWQPEGFAGAPAYVMPSTSGLNAHAGLPALVEHLRRALARSGDPQRGSGPAERHHHGDDEGDGRPAAMMRP